MGDQMSAPKRDDEDLSLDLTQLDRDIVRLDIYKNGQRPDDSFYQLELEPLESGDDFWNIQRNGRKISVLKKGSVVTSFDGLSFSRPDWFKESDRDFSNNWTTVNQKVDILSKIFGLGEKSGYLEKSGARYEMWNTDPGGFYKHHEDPIYASIPFYILAFPDGSGGEEYLGVYLANPHYSQFDVKYMSGPDNVGISVNSDSMTLCLITGEGPSDIIGSYTDLTGKPAMMPRWALGYHHSKYGMPKDQDEAIEVVEEFRDREVPCDSIYFDIQHMQDYKIFTWSEENFPEPYALMEKLHDLDIKPVTIQDPGVKMEKDYQVYESGREKDVFVENREGDDFVGMLWPGLSAFPDFVREEVREWWGKQNSKILDMGVSGIWNDMNEPAVFFDKDGFLDLISKTRERIDKGDISLEDFHKLQNYLINATEGLVHRDEDGNKIPHEKVHNLYALLEAEGTIQGFDSIYPEKRPFILTRAGFSGIQKYAAIWTGDNSSTWEHMKMSIQMILNLSLSGIPFSGADVGGFDGDVEPELLVRWNQLGSMIPLFRNHSSIGTVSQEPWSFGEPYERVIKRYIELRYELLPYFYTLHYKSHKTGTPIVRPLFLEFPEDEKAYEVEDEFMLGDSLLVAPVLERGAEKRRIYLPYGEEGEELKWENWWTGNILSSGHHTVSSPLDIMPMFIRGNRGIPTMNPVQSTEEEADTLYLRCNLEDELEIPIYWDDGKTDDFENGEYFYGDINVSDNNGEPVFSVRSKNDGFEPFWNEIEILVETVEG